MNLLFILSIVLVYLCLYINCSHHRSELQNNNYDIKKSSKDNNHEILALAKAFYEELQKKIHKNKTLQIVHHTTKSTTLSTTNPELKYKKYVIFQKNTIISWKSANNNGGKYLAKDSSKNKNECANKCYKQANCTLAIFQEKVINKFIY